MQPAAGTPISLPPDPRILVVALRRIGDVLLTTPLIRSLRRAWPKATIDALVFAGTEGIVDGNPDLDRVIAMPARPTAMQGLALAAKLWNGYDLGISTQSGDRPTVFAILAGRTHVGLAEAKETPFRTALKRLALDRAVPASQDIHRVEQLLRIADALGIERVPDMVCPAAAVSASVSPREPYAVIHATPMYRYKRWTAAGWRALAAGLAQRGLSVIAISGPDLHERGYLEEVWQGAVAIHQLSWAENVALLRRARVFVGPDTSASHLAAAAGCPTVALFGPMNPRVWAPWPVGGLNRPWEASGAIQRRGNVFIVQNPLPCMPCTFEGCERHVDSASACLEELSAERVLDAVDQALASENLPRTDAPPLVGAT